MNDATRSATDGSSREAVNSAQDANGRARAMRAARFAPIPGRAEIALRLLAVD